MDDAKEGDQDARETAPPPFRAAVDALRAARLRPEIEIDPTRPPQRLAPYAYALEAAVVADDEDLADGRLILLHDPAGHDAWQGSFRLVTLVRAELEPEMAADPLLPDVSWSWLTGALQARGLSYGEPSGTVTRADSHYFGGLSERPAASRSRSGPPGRPARAWAAYRTRPRTSRPGAICSVRSRACRGAGRRLGGDPSAAPGSAVPLNARLSLLRLPGRPCHVERAPFSTSRNAAPLPSSLPRFCRYGHFQPCRDMERLGSIFG